MRIALNRCLVATLDRVFQFTQATPELMVELAFSHQFRSFTSEGAFNFGEFLGERGDDGLG